MDIKKQYTCQFKGADVSLIITVQAVDMRDAINRFFFTEVGELLVKTIGFPIDRIQEVPANFDQHYLLAEADWSLQVDMVAKPSNSNRILVLKAFDWGENGFDPQFVVVTDPAELLRDVKRLMEVVQSHGLSEARISCSPDWGPGDVADEMRLTCGELVVGKSFFWFTDQPKHSESPVQSESFSLKHLIEVLTAEGSGPMYMAADPEDLKECYLNDCISKLDHYDEDSLVSDFYDTDQSFSQVLIDCIPNFEYPNFSGRTVAEVKEFIAEL